MQIIIQIQPTRAIGDVYMKHNEFNLAPHYLHGEPIAQPIVKAEPTIQTHPISPDDKFVIFASDGLWDEMDNIEAAELVRDNPRNVSAPSRDYFIWLLFFFVFGTSRELTLI